MNDSTSESVPCPGDSLRCTLLMRDSPLPLLLEPDKTGTGKSNGLNELLAWIAANKSWIDKSLLKYGGLLFRGFPVKEADEFEQIIRLLEPELLPYTEGQSQRSKVLSNIYTSTEYPPDQDITLHNELSYIANPPRRLFFYCHIEPPEGGETPITDCRRAYETMDPSVRDRFVERQIRYVKNMHGGKGFGKSWQEHFETSDRDEVETYLKAGDV